MKTIIVSAVLLAASQLAFAEDPKTEKHTAIVETTSGKQYQVSVPKAAITDVKQTGPNSYSVHVDRTEAKKIEVKPVDGKGTAAPGK